MKTQINWKQLHSEAVDEFQRLIPLLFGPQNMEEEEYDPIALKQAGDLIAGIANSTPDIQAAFIENLPLFVACAIGRDDAEADATIAAREAEMCDEECDCDFCIEQRCDETENRYFDLIVEDGEVSLVRTTLDEQVADGDRFGDPKEWVEFYIDRPGVWNVINTNQEVWEEAVAIYGDEAALSEMVDNVIDSQEESA